MILQYTSIVCTILLTYLNIVLFSVISKDYIREHVTSRCKPYICAIKLFHNIMSIFISMYLFQGILNKALYYNYKVYGNIYNKDEVGMENMLTMFYLSKFYELFDTMLMIAQSNYHQISFLHIYHHVSIIIVWLLIVKFEPGGDAYLSALINSFVHVIMYFYYLLASFIKNKTTRQKYLWWGKYLTKMQLLQFGINFIHAFYCLFADNYNKQIVYLQLFYMMTFMSLFAQFYKKKYIKTSN